MPPVNPELVEAFSAKAAIVNAVVQEVPSMAAALQYVVDVCENKAPAELLADEPGVQQGPLGPNKVPTRVQRIVAAPDLDDEDFAALALACEEKGFACLRNEKGRWGRKFQLSVMGSEGCFTGRKPSQSRLTPCQLSRRASFMSANHQMQKSSPFRGSWRAKRD